MIALKTFAKFANIKLTDFNPKPTTKTPGQVEASDILWESDDGKTKIGIWECTEGTFTATKLAKQFLITPRRDIIEKTFTNFQLMSCGM